MRDDCIYREWIDARYLTVATTDDWHPQSNFAVLCNFGKNYFSIDLIVAKYGFSLWLGYIERVYGGFVERPDER